IGGGVRAVEGDVEALAVDVPREVTAGRRPLGALLADAADEVPGAGLVVRVAVLQVPLVLVEVQAVHRPPDVRGLGVCLVHGPIRAWRTAMGSRLLGRVCVVTGASSGIGAAIGAALAAEGAAAVGLARRFPAAPLPRTPPSGQVTAAALDVTDEQAVA